MTRPAVPTGGDDGPEFARADAVTGLAREVEGLRRAVEPLLQVGDRVEELAGLLAQVADAVATVAARPSPTPAPSWLMLPSDPGATRRLLGELNAWLYAIFLRYPDGAAALPQCWLYHPDVVEELVWLMSAWWSAYQGPTASVALAGDWHERSRPGVVRRIRGGAGACSIERHQSRPDWDQTPTGAVAVPGLDTVEVITCWWAGGRDDAPPEPDVAVMRNGVPIR